MGTREAEREFYHGYGLALGAWSTLESGLGDLFVRLADLEPEIGRAIFYSARSFQGRTDMVRACISHVRELPDAKRFITRLLNRMSDFLSARNTLAHDAHLTRINRTGQVFLSSPAGGITGLSEIREMVNNFSWLSALVRESGGQIRLIREPELCLALLETIPDDPRRSHPDPSHAAQLLECISQSTD